MALNIKQIRAIYAEKKDKEKQGLGNPQSDLTQPIQPIKPLKPVTTKFNKIRSNFKKI